MAEIKVTSSEVRKKASELRQLNGQFKGKVGELEGVEQNLMGMWDGEAKQVFHSAFMSDKEQWGNFSSLIEQYAMALESIATEYDNKEALNVQIATQRKY